MFEKKLLPLALTYAMGLGNSRDLYYLLFKLIFLITAQVDEKQMI
jgi:hypothetical protein